MSDVRPCFEDVRQVLVDLPHGDPWGGTSYVQHDLFTVRHALIRALDPQPVSVFEFGALYGYFLVTALDAAPSIELVGWVDDESHTADSNRMCDENLRAYLVERGRGDTIVWHARDRDATTAMYAPTAPKVTTFDLVAVDSDHTYAGCLADLRAAHQLQPETIMVDDWIAATHTRDIQQAVLDFLDDVGWVYRLDSYVTTNGLAVLTRKEQA